MNSQGVGAGGVTFNVAANYIEPVTAPLLITATGTLGNPIIFQKDPATIGANPLVTRTDAGTLSTSTLSAQGDAIIIFQGSDYLTFDGIDVNTVNQGIEYGYYLRKASTTDGCKFVTIKNAVVTMTKGTSQYVAGIYSSNNDAASPTNSAVGITVASTGGRSENVTIIGNTVQNVFAGIVLRGYNHLIPPYDFYDQNFVVGQSGAGNTIQNYAGNAAAAAYGVYLIYHNNADVSYNIINNTAGGGSNFTSTGYGIFHSTAVNGNGTYNNNSITLSSTTGQLRAIMSGTAYSIATLKANNNTILLSQAGTSEASHIYFQSIVAPSAVEIINNTFSYGAFGSTGASYLIFCTTGANTVTVTGNQTIGPITKTGAGQFSCIHNLGAATGGSANVANNNFSNITLTGASTFYGIYYSTVISQSRNIFNNIISNITGGTNIAYGILTNNDGNPTNIYENSIINMSLTAAASGALYGISSGGAGSYGTLHTFNNIVSGLNNGGTGATYGLYQTGANPGIYHTYNNKVYDINGSKCSFISLWNIYCCREFHLPL